MSRDKALYALQAEHPETVINIGIFYYTGLVDTVAHIPERCYIADGFDVTNYEGRTRPEPGDRIPMAAIGPSVSATSTLRTNPAAARVNTNDRHTCST